MEYLGEIELENKYNNICKIFNSEKGKTDCNQGEDTKLIEEFEIDKNTIWFICFKNNTSLLKKIYNKNPKLANLVFEIVKEKNMEELIKWCENN